MIQIIKHKTKADIVLEMCEPKDAPRVYDDISNALRHSFEVLPQVGGITKEETKDRFERAFKIWVELRAEYEWTLDRIAAALGGCLVRSILGIAWEPQEGRRRKAAGRGTWAADGYKNTATAGVPVVGGDVRQVTHDLASMGWPSRGQL